MRINIALGMTPEWFEYSQVTIASILANASSEDDYSFYVLSSKFEKADKESFMKLAKIKEANFEFVLIDDAYFEGAIHDHLGVSSSYRLRLPSVVTESKVLYLDSDIIARKDIAELYRVDVSNHYLAAVEDKFSSIMKKRIKLEEGETFYNGGVQLINLDAYRENNLEAKMMEKLRQSDYYTDQDVVNDICRGNILRLPLRFNIMPLPKAYQSCQEEFKREFIDPVLVHYIMKPWLTKDGYFVSDWYKYKKIVTEI